MTQLLAATARRWNSARDRPRLACCALATALVLAAMPALFNACDVACGADIGHAGQGVAAEVGTTTECAGHESESDQGETCNHRSLAGLLSGPTGPLVPIDTLLLPAALPASSVPLLDPTRAPLDFFTAPVTPIRSSLVTISIPLLI